MRTTMPSNRTSKYVGDIFGFGLKTVENCENSLAFIAGRPSTRMTRVIMTHVPWGRFGSYSVEKLGI